jgi:hypothetical protein
VDSGASHHLTCRISDLAVTSDSEALAVRVADGRTVVATAKGRLCIPAMVEDNDGNLIQRNFTLDNVYFVPEMTNTLISVSALWQSGHEEVFAADSCTISMGSRRRVGCVARLSDGVYCVVTEDGWPIDKQQAQAHSAAVLDKSLET